MRKLIIGFSRPRADFVPFADGIRLITDADFSHTYIKFKSDSFDRVLIYQASGHAVNFIGETLFNEKNLVVAEFEIEVSDEAFKKTIQFAIDNSGVPYGILQIFGIMYVKALGLFGVTVRNPFKKNYVCSELVAQILKEIIGLEVEIDLNSIDPKEVFELLKKNQILETL